MNSYLYSRNFPPGLPVSGARRLRREEDAGHIYDGSAGEIAFHPSGQELTGICCYDRVLAVMDFVVEDVGERNFAVLYCLKSQQRMVYRTQTAMGYENNR